MYLRIVYVLSRGTWELVLFPAVKIIVGCQWAYIAKNGPNGYIEPDSKAFLLWGFFVL